MRGSPTPDYYQLLGVSPSASHADIKARYRLLSKQHHPDMGGSQTHMARLNQAYAILSDKFKRAIYDAERRRTLAIAPGAAARSQSTAPTRPPVRSKGTFRSARTRRPSWWPKVAWGFAAAVIIAGILLHLPIAEAISPPESPTSASKPLVVTYPTETALNPVASKPNPTFYTAPDGATYSEPSNQAQSETAAPEGKNSTERQCKTKTYGSYQRTVCRSADGTTVCSVNTLGNQRFGTCQD